MKKLLLLKIGGGVITDKKVRYGLLQDVLTKLIREIAEAYRNLQATDLIIGNGAGSFAHFSAKEYRTAEGFVDERSRVGLGWVRYDAVKLNQIVLEELLKVGVPAFSFSPSSFLQVKNGKTKKMFLHTIQDALTKALVPLVYGDPVIDGGRGSGIYSTEKVFDDLVLGLVRHYDQTRIIHVSNEEGVLVNGQVVEEITRRSFGQMKHGLRGSHGTDVTGGMLHKVEECLELTRIGIMSQIVSGQVKGRVQDAILGKKVKGTIIK